MHYHLPAGEQLFFPTPRNSLPLVVKCDWRKAIKTRLNFIKAMLLTKKDCRRRYPPKYIGESQEIQGFVYV